MSSFRYPLEDIKERVDLVEIISQHVALRKSGRRLVGLCPFHNEKTPSFYVDPDRQLWKCFGCGEGGDVFEFVCKYENVSFSEAVEQLARKAGVTIEKTERAAREYTEKERVLRANNIACAFFRSMLAKSEKAKEYIARRGLTNLSIEKYRLGYAPESWDELYKHLQVQKVSTADAVKAGLIVPRESSQGFYDRFRDRIMFPIFDNSDRVIAFGGRALGDDPAKYLNSPETPLFIKSKTLYGLNFARRAIAKEDFVIIVEGYMDAITAQEAGFENTVATLGTALTEEHVNILARFTNNVVLAFDADSAGMKAALRSWPIFERAGLNVRILNMPKGEDPDSLLRNGDRTKFAELLDKSLPVPDYQIELIISKYDVKSDEGKAAALKEIVKVLAEIDNLMERERLIRVLAKYHPNFSTGTALAEDHLRAEVNRQRALVRRNPQTVNAQVHQEAKLQKNKLSLVEKSERLLLGMIIVGGVEPNKVFGLILPNEFTEERCRLLAERLNSQYQTLGKIDAGMLATELAGTPEGVLLTDILMGMDESELNHPLEELVRVIDNHKKNERRQRMRYLADKIAEGSIKHGDEEYEEYLRLVRETSGHWRR